MRFTMRPWRRCARACKLMAFPHLPSVSGLPPSSELLCAEGLHRWHGGHMQRITISSLIRTARRKLLVPAGLAAAIGLATFAPALQPPTTPAAAAERQITPGKRRDQVVDVYDKV